MQSDQVTVVTEVATVSSGPIITTVDNGETVNGETERTLRKPSTSVLFRCLHQFHTLSVTLRKGACGLVVKELSLWLEGRFESQLGDSYCSF